ncbi:hypothetical protein V1264_000315 [Littorina saxatilis]
MAELAAGEASLLKAIDSDPLLDATHVTVGAPTTSNTDLKRFAKTRLKVVGSTPEANRADHPNAAFLLLHAFLHKWQGTLQQTPELHTVFSTHGVALPSQEDMEGAIAGILRLQRVYNISTMDIYAGNYRGFTGPALSPLTAFAIGRQAFSDGLLTNSVEWLQFALNKMRSAAGKAKQEVTSNPEDDGVYNKFQIANAIGLLGRAYAYKGDYQKARELYAECKALDGNNAENAVLAHELKTRPGKAGVSLEKEAIPREMSELCSRPKQQTVSKIQHFNRCRLKPSLFLPYVRYKEEILSLEPYASIFHEVIHDTEIERLKALVKGQMTRANVEQGKGEGHVGAHSYVRTSDLGWLWDTGHPTVKTISRRVQDITWLNTHNYNAPVGPDSAEALQVLNYGIGGHYNVHVDNLQSDLPLNLQQSGTRIVTFLFYLSDVDMGGYTVFPKAGISVAPVKGTALFWCNVNPAQELQDRTLHAGCPVIKGHKWVANKWIWTYGNEYRRPCGPYPNSTQLDTEDITFSRRHYIPRDSFP